MGRGGRGPGDLGGWVQGVGLMGWVTRSGLVWESPSARSAVAREARLLVEFLFTKEKSPAGTENGLSGYLWLFKANSFGE